MKAAQKTLAAQGKTTKSIWANGGSKGLTVLLAGFTDGGKVKKGAAGKAVKAATLADIAEGREIIATRLENANARLEEMQGQYDQLKSSTSSSIRGELDLKAGIGQDTVDQWGHTVKGKTTFASVSSQVMTMSAKARTFAGKLKALVSKGIRAGLVQEVAALGTTEGITVADVLLSGTAAEVE
ncbi:hypothetical protein ACTVCO_10115 [Sanguibacter sp. A247]|uniref:hypothetical protein n=1 Tax=unclassified Sanguibacter TaxID=2645534 RepID=UPI003FD88891